MQGPSLFVYTVYSQKCTPLVLYWFNTIHTHTRFLLDSGAFPALVNNEGDTPVDVAEDYEEIQDMITAKVSEQGINVDDVRSVEEAIMLEDANRWASTRICTLSMQYDHL